MIIGDSIDRVAGARRQAAGTPDASRDLMPLWFVVPLLVVMLLFSLPIKTNPESAEEILKRRHASGELDRETYERMLHDLHSREQPTRVTGD